VESGRIVSLKSTQTRGPKKPNWYTSTREGCAPINEYSLPVLPFSISLPISITREKGNCAFGNTVNLLDHFISGLKEKLLRLKETSGCCFTEIEDAIRKCGYDVLKIPSISVILN
jgi:hypothetical protein